MLEDPESRITILGSLKVEGIRDSNSYMNMIKSIKNL